MAGISGLTMKRAPGGRWPRRAPGRLFGAEEPPPRRLATEVVVELRAVWDGRRHLVALERCPLAGDNRQQLSSLAHALDRRCQCLCRLAPGNQFLVDVADRVALPEAALGVVARGRS